MSARLRHIAIIMDGNGRWAKRQHSLRTKGHRAGVSAAYEVVQACVKQKIEVLSLFAMSTENFQRRPKLEIRLLMQLMKDQLFRRVDELHQNNIQLRIIGDRSVFIPSIQDEIANAETLTENNTGLILNIAVNYSGRWDTVQAVRKLIQRHDIGELSLQDIDENSLSHYHCLHDLPDPDLLIRTGGDSRISNFYLWQLAYTELYFSEQYWPDFDKDSLQQAIDCFAQRQRRYGKTGCQIKEENYA